MVAMPSNDALITDPGPKSARCLEIIAGATEAPTENARKIGTRHAESSIPILSSSSGKTGAMNEYAVLEMTAMTKR